MKTLVAFYSRADENYFGGTYRYISVGNTQRVAQVIAQETGADLFAIQQVQPYAAEYQTCVAQAREDFYNKARPAVQNLPENLDDYDEIYLGYPNYCGDMPMAVYTFLEAFSWEGKTIHPFCTHEGSGLSDTERSIQYTCTGAAVTKGLAVHGSHVDSAQHAIQAWIKKL
jgi:flavodoxin